MLDPNLPRKCKVLTTNTVQVYAPFTTLKGAFDDVDYGEWDPKMLMIMPVSTNPRPFSGNSSYIRTSYP